MNRILYAVLLGACAAPAFAGDVGISISVGQPGFYGQIDIGHFPQPQLVYTQPVVVQPAPQFAVSAPIYLHVRPGDERNWREHCEEYNACGRPVYFVRDNWYNNEYVQNYRHADEDEDEDSYGGPQGGFSARFGEPGFYGQVIIGASTPPQLIYAQPVVIQRSPEFVSAAPIYLHVPPGQEKHWGKHCVEYNACGRPVYFVRDDWYNNEYVTHHRHNGSDQEGDHGHRRGHGKGHGHDAGHDDDGD